MKKIKNIIEVLRLVPWWVNHDELCNRRAMASIVLMGCAMIMGIMNYINHSELMFKASVVLVIGFAVSAFTAKFLHKSETAEYILVLMVSVVLTLFGVTGGNNGFAILWILLVPTLSFNLISIKSQIIMNTYFLIMIITIFWTPLFDYVKLFYTTDFVKRFPVLYIGSYLITMYLAIRSEYCDRKINIQSYTDGLTNTFNRKYFDEMLNTYSTHENFSITVIDINGLKHVNDNLGHKAGDELICSIPDCCRKVLDSYSVLCRTGGDEFCIISYNPPDKVEKMLEKLKNTASEWTGTYCSSMHYAYGEASKINYPDFTGEELYKQADSKMYEDKNAYYEKTKIQKRH